MVINMATSKILRPAAGHLQFIELTKNDNFDDIYELGFYSWTTSNIPQNSPISGAGRMIIFGLESNGTGNKAQLAVNVNGEMFLRFGVNAGWPSEFKKYVPLLDRVIALEEECKPHIISQPESQSVSAGTVISFTVEARNAGVYQWQYRTSANGAWTNPSTGANKSIYSLTAQTRHNGYQYHCIVSNTLGEVTTSIVTLTVT